MTGSFKTILLFAFMSSLHLSGCNRTPLETSNNMIVSTTLCADGYLLALPNIEPRLGALSWQSRSALATTPEHLKSLPQTDDDLERSLKWAKAVRVSSAGGRGEIDLSWGEDFDTVWRNFDLLSLELGAQNITPNLKSRLDRLQKPITPPRVLYLDRAGATAGPGTFVDAVIQAAGGENVISYPGWQSPDLERLMTLQPDIIITSFMDSDYAGVNDRTSRHAALTEKINAVPKIHIPGRYWPCAGPGLVEAAEMLNQGLLSL